MSPVTIGLEITCLLIVGIPTFIHNLLTSTFVFKRGFFCNDQTIAYPDKPDTISGTFIFTTIITPNLIAILILEWSRARRLKLTRKKLILTIYRIYLFFLFGGFIATGTTEILKFVTGRLRPNFLRICEANGTLLDEFCRNSLGYDVYVDQDVCTNDSLLIPFVRDSFPSAHTSAAFYCVVFLVSYLQSSWKCGEFKLFKGFIQYLAILLAICISLTRITDYKHHPTDVFGGVLIGILTALITINQMKKNNILND